MDCGLPTGVVSSQEAVPRSTGVIRGGNASVRAVGSPSACVVR